MYMEESGLDSVGNGEPSGILKQQKDVICSSFYFKKIYADTEARVMRKTQKTGRLL